MKSFNDVDPAIERGCGLACDFKFAADFFKQSVGEGVVVVTFDSAWQAKVGKDVIAKCSEDGVCCHVYCRKEPDEPGERVPHGEDVIESVGWWGQFPIEVKIEDFHWLAASRRV